MKIFRVIKKIFVFLFAFQILIGCSNKLSRDMAKIAIIAKFNFPYEETGYFTFGKRDNNFEQQKLLKKLVKEELIEIKHEEPKDSFSAIIMLGMLGSGILPEQYLVGTDKGNQYIFKIDYNESKEFNKVYVKADSIKFGEVTGILEMKDANKAEVEYTIFRKDVTPFGKIVWDFNEGDGIKKKVTFARYDDGWKISE